MLVMGIISGAGTLLLPLDILGNNVWSIETIRFFFAHLVIFMCPFFSYVFKIRKLEGKWIKDTIIITLLVIFIAGINNLAFTYLLEGKEAYLNYLKSLGL